MYICTNNARCKTEKGSRARVTNFALGRRNVQLLFIRRKALWKCTEMSLMFAPETLFEHAPNRGKSNFSSPIRFLFERSFLEIKLCASLFWCPCGPKVQSGKKCSVYSSSDWWEIPCVWMASALPSPVPFLNVPIKSNTNWRGGRWASIAIIPLPIAGCIPEGRIVYVTVTPPCSRCIPWVRMLLAGEDQPTTTPFAPVDLSSYAHSSRTVSHACVNSDCDFLEFILEAFLLCIFTTGLRW